jgi:hypothetical protein
MPDLIHIIKRSGSPLRPSVPSALRHTPVDVSMFSNINPPDRNLIERFRTGEGKRVVLADTGRLILVERMTDDPRGLQTWVLPVQALSQPAAGPEPGPEAARSARPGPQADAGAAGEPNDVTVDADEPDGAAPCVPAVAADDYGPSCGAEPLAGPPPVRRFRRLETVLATLALGSFVSGGVLGVSLSRGTAVLAPRPQYEGRPALTDPRLVSGPPAAPQRPVDLAQFRALVERLEEAAKVLGTSGQTVKRLEKEVAGLRTREKQAANKFQEMSDLYDRGETPAEVVPSTSAQAPATKTNRTPAVHPKGYGVASGRVRPAASVHVPPVGYPPRDTR